MKKIFCIGSIVMIGFFVVCLPVKAKMTQLVPDEINQMRLISEAYGKMQKVYFREITFKQFENFFYRVEVLAATLLKNNADDFKEQLEALIYSSLVWMVRELRDPTDTISRFVHKKDISRAVRESFVSKFAGIGIEVEHRDDAFFVRVIYADSAAFDAQVVVGDEIVFVDGENVYGLTLNELERRLDIPIGTAVVLTLMRGGERFDVTLISREIIVTTVTSHYYEKERVGYVRIAEFRNATADEMRGHLDELLRKQCVGLVVDLRGNSGGNMDQAVALCDIFLPKDMVVCYFVKRDVGRKDQITTHDAIQLHGIKEIVFLVDTETGSSAEIVAGVLRYYKYGVIVGTKTKGMGSLKNTIGLSDGSVLYLITSRTYLPNETTFDAVGLVPDSIVTDHDEQLSHAFAIIADKNNENIKR